MKKSHIVALLVIALAIGGLVAMSSDYSSYATFDQAALQEGKEFRVIGNLNENKDMHYDPIADPNLFSFQMIDKDGIEREVVFNGTKPRDFERSEDIVLTGKMDGDTFQASNILLKCPSKYVEDEIEIREYSAKSSWWTSTTLTNFYFQVIWAIFLQSLLS